MEATMLTRPRAMPTVSARKRPDNAFKPAPFAAWRRAADEMRGTMKAMLIATTLLLTACAHQPAASNSGLGTSVSGQHVANVTRDVQGWHNAQNPDCPFTRAVKATVVDKDSDGVTERWTIEGCDGRLFDYEAYIMPMGGGLTVMVSNADGSPASVTP